MSWLSQLLAATGKAKAAHIPLYLLSIKALLSIAEDLLNRLGGGTLSRLVEILASYAGGNPRAFETLLVAGCHCLRPERARQDPQQTAISRTRVESKVLKQVGLSCHTLCMMPREGPAVALCMLWAASWGYDGFVAVFQAQLPAPAAAGGPKVDKGLADEHL